MYRKIMDYLKEWKHSEHRKPLIPWGYPVCFKSCLLYTSIREAIADGKTEFEAYVVKDGALKPFTLRMGELTPDEKDIILKGDVYKRQVLILPSQIMEVVTPSLAGEIIPESTAPIKSL